MTWDVTAIVKAWIEGGQPNYGFLIRDPNDGVSGTDVYVSFCSKEYSDDPSKQPILEVDWSTPSPTPTPRPAGGIVMSTNKFEILTPYLALAGLVVAIVSAVVVVRRRSID